jgi:ribosome maturation factor RimP
MTKKETIEHRTEELVSPILESTHCTLVDVEYVKEAGTWYLRVYADKQPGGIFIDDCEKISRALEEKLDEEDFIDGEYVLEVSSPGLDRPLKKPRDFERSIGEDIELKFYKPFQGEKEWVGKLLAYSEEAKSIRVMLEEEEPEGVEIALSDLSMIRLYIEF